MLLSLAQWLQSISPEFGAFRVFQYLTFRAVMAALTALLIGLLAGLVSFVPYLGFIVGAGAAVIAALVQYGDLLHLLLVVGVFSVGQMLESFVLTPWLVGDRIGMHPVAVIFAIMAGGQLFGFLGVRLALPVAAVVMVLLRYAHERYTASGLYGANAPAAATTPGIGGTVRPDGEPLAEPRTEAVAPATAAGAAPGGSDAFERRSADVAAADVAAADAADAPKRVR